MKWSHAARVFKQFPWALDQIKATAIENPKNADAEIKHWVSWVVKYIAIRPFEQLSLDGKPIILEMDIDGLFRLGLVARVDFFVYHDLKDGVEYSVESGLIDQRMVRKEPLPTVYNLMYNASLRYENGPSGIRSGLDIRWLGVVTRLQINLDQVGVAEMYDVYPFPEHYVFRANKQPA